MQHIVVDPVTRIEGHLRVELTVDEASGRVTDALSSGTAWRGLELIMQGRDPRDAWAYIQRICGVCTTAHALAGLRAVEDALNIKIPKNANFIRNIMAASLTVQDHIVHFYHLQALDWVSPMAALSADPAATARVAASLAETYKVPSASVGTAYSYTPKDFPAATPDYFRTVQKKLRTIVESGQLGIFSAQWWEHPDYSLLPPEVHLMAVCHYLEILDKQRELVTPHVIFGGKNPHPHYVMGGMPCSISLRDGNSPINAARLAEVEKAIDLGRCLVAKYHLPDALAMASAYVKAGYLDGAGLSGERVMAFGSFPEEPFLNTKEGGFFNNLLIRTNGVVEKFSRGAQIADVHNVSAEDLSDPEYFGESVGHAWYEYQGTEVLHPWDGQTKPHFTGPKDGTDTDWRALNEQGKYSWVKTPKWKGKLCEVGPLARYIVVYTKARQQLLTDMTWAEKMMVDQVDYVSTVLGKRPEEWMPSMVGRTVTRALDAQLNAEIARHFFDSLVANVRIGDTQVANMERWDPATWPKKARGVGLYEAPRGALSHWVTIDGGKIEKYQCIVPTTWNACPRDDKAGRGAYEAAMMQTRVKNPRQPLEILKVIRSFDPCMACATHMYNPQGEELRIVTTDPFRGSTVEEADSNGRK